MHRSPCVHRQPERVLPRPCQFSPPNDPPTAGNVDPLKLGELLSELGLPKYPNRVLAGARVHKGRTDRRSGEKVYHSDDRRMGT